MPVHFYWHRLLGFTSPSNLCQGLLRKVDGMNLIRTYSKLMLVRNKYNYLIVTLSIILIYIIISVLMIYIDNILILSSEFMFPNFRYLYISIRTVFLIGGITFIISQYYNIMKAGTRDYLIMKSLGATKGIVRSLIVIQIVLLILITIPLGLFSGYLLSNLILNSISDFSLSTHTQDLLDSTRTFYIIAVSACCFIISIGIYLERGISRTPVSSIIIESVTNKKDVWYYDYH